MNLLANFLNLKISNSCGADRSAPFLLIKMTIEQIHKRKYIVYKLFIDNGGVVWYTIYRVKGEDKKRNLNKQIFKVATWQQKGYYHGEHY